MKSTQPADYQTVLRAIGQGIEKLNVASFELETTDNQEYLVSGVYREGQRTGKPKKKSSLLSLIVNEAHIATRQNTEGTLFRFAGVRFSRSNIDLLDRAGKASRWNWDGNPLNPLGISQVLRIAGAYLDSKHIRFSRLSWHHQTLTLWHLNALGSEVKEVFTSANLYDHWVRRFKARRPAGLLKPTGSDY